MEHDCTSQLPEQDSSVRLLRCPVPTVPQDLRRPRLHAPANVKINKDGTESPPEPEKSFLQKCTTALLFLGESADLFYTDWVYLLPVVVLILTGAAGGQEEGAQKKE